MFYVRMCSGLARRYRVSFLRELIVCLLRVVYLQSANFKMAASEEIAVDAHLDETPTRKRKQKARRWSDEEIESLIDLFEQHACLWDIISKGISSKGQTGFL